MPATIKSRWISEWLPVSKLYPAGCTGCLEITSPTRRGPVTAAYMVEAILDGSVIVGWELTNLATDQEYAIDHLSWGWSQSSCTCGQNVFRSARCKHSIALEQALKQIGEQS